MKKSAAKSGGKRQAGRVHRHEASDLCAEDQDGRDLSRPFTIVGLGASAGGLEALEVFFRKMPEDSGMGFVVVQHLDPDHEDMLAELLQRHTAMPVRRIEDGTSVEPNHVYVIPPNRDLSILHGVLYLLEPSGNRGLRLPIDFFFRSLAEDWRERSVGVILSGMGMDGTLGLRAISEQCGAVFVQSPESAKFDSMVRSAIQEGLADVVAPIEELPARILEYVRHTTRPVMAERAREEGDSGGLEKVLILLRRQTGHDFSVYKRSTIWRRIERRMSLHHLGAIDDYVRYLRDNRHEVDLLFKEMLIGVTSFFRDPAVWERLGDEVLPELIRGHSAGTILRAWVAGCSTGEEAYSLAIVFHEALEMVDPPPRISLQVFATDLDKDAIERARAAVYPAGIAKDVSEERLNRFFTRDERGFRVNKEIREMVVFARQNVVSDAPFTKLDILSCRNLLIYLFADLQKKLLPLFHYCLNPGGFLVLGNAETIGPATDLFVQLGGKERIFRRLETSAQLARMHFPVAFKHLPGHAQASGLLETGKALPQQPDIQMLASAFLLEHYSPVAVLTSEAGDILYIHGKTGHLLEPAAGRANWNLFAMAREDLNHALFEVFHRAVRKKEVLEVKDLQLATNGGTRVVNLTVHPIAEPAPLKGMVMVTFTQGAAVRTVEPKGKLQSKSDQSTKVAELGRELRQAHEEMQVLREEMQTTGEELKSSNEELQSANEELQSMNEELTTSKEEMQSMNEELQVVNQDLMIKLQDLSRSNNDMKNLLSSTDTATLFLDNDLNVRWFAPQTAEIIHLIASDIGRPVTDLVSQLDYPKLAEDIREVLRTLVPLKKEIPCHDGRWFAVRIIPYRTKESMIDGLVVTFLDVSEAHKLAVDLQACKTRLLEISEQKAGGKEGRE
jgi:two-component system CheB/CheR fusion protein